MNSSHQAGGRRLIRAGVLAWVTLLALGICDTSWGLRTVVGPQATGPGGVINLPYQVADSQGNLWMIYQQGWLQQQGNQPVYSQGAMLNVNGNQPNVRQNTARLDEKTGEVIFENMQAAGFTITRRILIDKEAGYVRYIDVVKNTQNREQTVNLQINTNLNYGVQSAQMVPDPKRKGQNLGWAANTHANRAVAEVFSGVGTKVAPTINWSQGSNTVVAQLQVVVPGNKEVAWMHLHAIAPTQEQAAKFIAEIKPRKLMAAIPKELRKIIVNFPAGNNFVGEYEILRGEVLDVVELRGGDRVQGTIQEQNYALRTFYGDVTLPAERVVAMINVGQYRPRQLLVTTDGEIYGGNLQKETLNLQLSSGQTTQMPVTQITRFGVRKRAGEPEEWTFNKPMVLLRSGDRVALNMPTEPVQVVTRYGKLDLPPASVAAILFQNEENSVHQVILTDGSAFAALYAPEQFEMNLSGSTAQGPVKVPSSTIARLQFSPLIDEISDETPTFQMTSGDLLVGTVSGEMKLDTAFDTLTVHGPQIARIVRAENSPVDVQLTLWDNTSVSGQLQSPEIICQLKSGAVMKVPVSLITQYTNPRPQPSALMVDQIKLIVAQLNADDWKQRDQAQAQLISIGLPVVSVLQEVRAVQPPEAQQRIDQILAAVEKEKKADGAATAPPTPMMMLAE